jgi:hypothetical protein
MKQRHENLLTIKRSKPVAEPLPTPADGELFGSMAGSVLSEADIVSAADAEWEAASKNRMGKTPAPPD